MYCGVTVGYHPRSPSTAATRRTREAARAAFSRSAAVFCRCEYRAWLTILVCWSLRVCSAPSGVVRPDGTWAYRAREKGEEVFIVDLDDDMLGGGGRAPFATSDGLQPTAAVGASGSVAKL